MAKKSGFSARMGKSKGKEFTKVIKSIKSPKTGAYHYQENIIHKDLVNDFFKQEQDTPAESPTESG